MDIDLKLRVEKTLGLPLNNGYGLSETSPTIAVPLHNQPRKDESIGNAIPGVQTRFVNPATGKDVPLGGRRTLDQEPRSYAWLLQQP